MEGLHVREHRDGPVEAQLTLSVHGVHRHLAELGPGQHRVRAEVAVLVAVQHAHQAQGLHRHGGLRVADVSEPDGVRRGRARRQDQQGRRHAHRQQGAQKSFFHRFLPPYTDLP